MPLPLAAVVNMQLQVRKKTVMNLITSTAQVKFKMPDKSNLLYQNVRNPY